MFKRSFFCFCVFFIGSILIINSAYALLLSFSPLDQTVIEGEHAYVDLTINTDGVFVGGYDLIVQFDPITLDITQDDIQVASNIGGLPGKREDLDIDYDSGTIFISWMGDESVEIENIIQDEFMTLATFDFLAENVGTSYLRYIYLSLYDAPGAPNPILHRNFNDHEDALAEITDIGSITVFAGQTSQTGQAAIPEPATFLLLGTLLVGFVVFKRKET